MTKKDIIEKLEEKGVDFDQAMKIDELKSLLLGKKPIVENDFKKENERILKKVTEKPKEVKKEKKVIENTAGGSFAVKQRVDVFNGTNYVTSFAKAVVGADYVEQAQQFCNDKGFRMVISK